MWDYTETVKDHFLHPRNVGEIEDADGVGMEGSLACGDALKISFKLDDEGRIADVKFKTFGCASAIASASILTEMVKGLTIEEAAHVSNSQIVTKLGGLPDQKLHCSVMGEEALKAAICNFKTGKHATRKTPVGRIICNCFGVTENDIESAVRDHHLTAVDQIGDLTKAGTACGSCKDDIKDIIDRVLKEMKNEEGKPAMTNLEKIEKIKSVIESTIRPALQQDGGDIRLIDVEANTVKVELQGACSGCPMAAMTLKGFVEEQIKQLVDPALVIEAVR
ncbi:MAG: Fe-S cluster assembly protein NifU [Spartobacteria bacterium]|nr:Fe-S cluster assembly protein NifU [Spartobacteria bacterium]